MKATNKKASTSPKIELKPALCRVVWLFKFGHMGYFRIKFPSRITHTQVEPITWLCFIQENENLIVQIGFCSAE